MPEITCDEMLELASLGAKVLHPRAVEIARNYGIPLVVRSSWSDEPGTKVVAPPVQERSLVGLEIAKAVDGVEYDGDQAKVALLRVPDRPGVAAKLFQDISQREVDIDLIIQSIHDGNSNDIAYSVSRNLLAKAEAVTTAIAPTLKSSSEATDEAEIMVEAGIAKIAIAGAGMIGRPGIAAKMFRTLANAGINIEMISTSEVKVSCVIDQRDASNAINALNQAFGVKLTPPRRAGHSGALPVVRGVALDQEQAQIAIRFVPDRPGMAAKLFTDLADEGISVDMIIQSQRCRINQGKPCRDIAFMVAESNSQLAKNLLETLIQGWPGSDVVVNPAIAKVSIVGSGMVGQPGVAGHFFAALAKEGINIEMIATSEIKISCVVPQERGIDALRATHQAFGLSGEQNVIVPA